MKKTDNIQTSNAEMVTISRAEYEEKNARLASQDERISRLENQVELLTEALRLSRHKQFGASSEKSEDTLMEQLSFLFNEAEVFSAAEKKEADRVTVVAARKRHKKHEYALDNIPEGMAVSVPLISGGMAKWKAVLITASSGIPTILGALIGYWLGEIGPLGLTLSLGFASGAMLYVVFGEILPQSILMYHSKLPAFSTIVGMLVGLLIIFY